MFEEWALSRRVIDEHAHASVGMPRVPVKRISKNYEECISLPETLTPTPLPKRERDCPDAL